MPAVSGDSGCRPWVEQDEGPYYLPGQPFRGDLVEDRIGVPMRLAVSLRADDNSPVAGAIVDVWHCDALGRYSGFPPSGGTDRDAAGADDGAESFLRGRQLTDGDGRSEFRTIYPGWYGGRTVHIHLIADVAGRRFTSQLFFPDSLTDEVLSRPPYAERPDRDIRNGSDEIFAHEGDETVLAISRDGDGYRASICLRVGR